VTRETYWGRTARMTAYPWRLTYRFGVMTAESLGYAMALRLSVKVIRRMVAAEAVPGSLRITVDRETETNAYVIRARWTLRAE
jgi:hypothetical protein